MANPFIRWNDDMARTEIPKAISRDHFININRGLEQHRRLEIEFKIKYTEKRIKYNRWRNTKLDAQIKPIMYSGPTTTGLW